MKGAAFFAFASLIGCHRTEPSPAPSKVADTAIHAKETAAKLTDVRTPYVIAHEGILLDLGEGQDALFMRANTPKEPPTERQGRRFLPVRKRIVRLRFPSIDPTAGSVLVSARVHGRAARAASLKVNGRSMGSVSFPPNVTETVHFALSDVPLGKTNELELQFHGRLREGELAAELDWIHIGHGEWKEGAFVPARADVLAQRSIAGSSKESFTLKSPSTVRFLIATPPRTAFRFHLGVQGEGDAEAEVRTVSPSGERTPLFTTRAKGGAWTPFERELPPHFVGALELVVTTTHRGARGLVGDPELVTYSDADEPKAERVDHVVLYIASGMTPASARPLGGSLELPQLGSLLQDSQSFAQFRAVSPHAHANLASMLTGLPPHKHKVIDLFSRLPRTVPYAPEILRQRGVVTALFSAHPLTSPQFGFGRGWDLYDPRSPVDDGMGRDMLHKAAAWLDAHAASRTFVVIHARGGHAPWEVSPEKLRDLAPHEYTGSMDPKHPFDTLTHARKVGRFSESDRTRAWALYQEALVAEDQAFSSLARTLTSDAMRGRVLFVFATDPPPTEVSGIPFQEPQGLLESQLSVPLFVKGPREGPRPPAGSALSAPDLFSLLLRALAGPLDLEAFRTMSERGRMAVDSNGAAFRYGGHVLLVRNSGEEKLCEPTSDPTCENDLTATLPILADVLHTLYAKETDDMPAVAPEPVTLDPKTVEALRVWGITIPKGR